MSAKHGDTTDNRVALVTGGSGGIGAACVRRLVAEGCRVAFTYRSGTVAAHALVEETGAYAVALDLADEEGLVAAVEAVEAEVGRVNVLVHNAGTTRDTLLAFLRESAWDEVMAVNLKGAYRLTRSLLRGMLLQRWGRIISIASLSAQIGHVGQAHYSAAKAGLIAFTKTVAREAAGYGVTANAVVPGFIDTPMLEAIPEAKREVFREAVPLRRWGRPEEVAGLVAYLASEEAAYMTGQTLRLDGGLEMA